MSRQILNGWKEISNHIERGVSAGILVVFRDTIAGLQDQRKMNLVGSFAS